MNVLIAEEPISTLWKYASISIAFQINCVFKLAEPNNNRAEIVLSEQVLCDTRIKDYDAIAGNGPAHWPLRFDVSKWGLLVARFNQCRVGGAVVAYFSPDVEMLEGRRDLCVLWDIRVDPKFRRNGIGSALFDAVESWCMSRGCRQLKIETQNTNVPACNFYARHGCILEAANFLAYPEYPDEVQLLWYKDLRKGT